MANAQLAHQPIPKPISTLTDLEKRQMKDRFDEAERLVSELSPEHRSASRTETFNKLNEILCHELLYLRAFEDKSIACAFDNNWVSDTLKLASQRLVHSEGREPFIGREAQARLILTLIMLLYAHGVSGLAKDYYEQLFQNLDRLFRDLRWETVNETSIVKYRKAQCSFLLSACREHTARFKKNQPRMIDVGSRLFHLLSAGFMAASPAMGGTPNPAKIMEAVEEAVASFDPKPQEKYQSLFTIQEAVILAQASLLSYRRIEPSDERDGTRVQLQQALLRCAYRGLRKVLKALQKEGSFAEGVSPPSAFWTSIMAALGHGPPTLNRYHYLFGLINSAIDFQEIRQGLGVVSEGDELKAEAENLVDHFRIILEQVQEKTCRWKLLEYLIVSSTDLSSMSENVLGSSTLRKHDIMADFRMICQLRGMQTPANCSTDPAARSRTSSLSSGSIMRCQTWQEAFTAPIYGRDSQLHEIETSERSFIDFLKRRVAHDLVGLTPDCRAAFLIGKKHVRIHAIELLGSTMRTSLIFAKDVPNKKHWCITQAAISNRFLGLIMERKDTRRGSKLVVYDFRHCAVCESDRCKAKCEQKQEYSMRLHLRWKACRIAVHDQGPDCWIALAADAGAGEDVSGAYVKLFRVSRKDDSLTNEACETLFVHKDENVLSLSSDPEDGKMLCITNANRIVVWGLWGVIAPQLIGIERFEREVDIFQNIDSRVTSATCLRSPATRNPYVVYSTEPTSECSRSKHAEWSCVVPICEASQRELDLLTGPLIAVGEERGLIACAASPRGNMIAMMQKRGDIQVLRLKPQKQGGIGSGDPGDMVKLQCQLDRQETATPMAMRFRLRNGLLELFAIGHKGQIVWKRFD